MLVLTALGWAPSTASIAQTESWDSTFSDSHWYVPVPNLVAYAASIENFTTPPPIPIGDQTLWSLGSATNGVFTGVSQATFAIGSSTSTSTTAMQGIVTQSGQIRIVFSSPGTPDTVGIGQMTSIGGVPEMEMQMVTGSSLIITHWAYMLPYNPATFTPPAAQAVPAQIVSSQWSWTAGTTWKLVSPGLFGSTAPGTFKIAGFSNGYVWGPGTGPAGSSGTNFTEFGSITPEGNVLVAVSINGVLTSLAGRITGNASDATIAMRGYTGSSVFGSAAVAQIMSSSNIAGGMTYFASNLGGSLRPAFTGGTLQIDADRQTYSPSITLDGSATNTIDQRGHLATLAGVLAELSAGHAGQSGDRQLGQRRRDRAHRA